MSQLKSLDLMELVLRQQEKLQAQKDAEDPLNPSHYVSPHTDAHGLLHATVDSAEAFFQEDLYLGTAFIYMARAGRKGIAPTKQDIEKAIWWLQRKLKMIDQSKVAVKEVLPESGP